MHPDNLNFLIPVVKVLSNSVRMVYHRVMNFVVFDILGVSAMPVFVESNKKQTVHLLYEKNWPVIAKSKAGLLLTALVSMLLSPAASSIAQESALQVLEKEFQKVVTSARTAVVKVVVTQQRHVQLPTTQQKMLMTSQSIGSGIIIDTDGYIATTTFDKDVQTIQVIFNNGKSSSAKLIGEDSLTDIAVLQVPRDKIGPALRMRQGDSTKIDTGSWVVTVGNSYGNSPMISFGIVSGWDTLPNHLCTNLIKINAPVTPGNSGGAIVNTAGETVGMILAVLAEPSTTDVYTRLPEVTEFRIAPLSQRWVHQEITFAIPIETVTMTAKEIITHGRVARGWLGVDVEITSGKLGCIITKVHKDSPAHRIGLLPRDVILEFDNTPMRTYPELLRCVTGTKPNTRIDLKISRNGHERNYVVTLGER